MAVLVKCFPFGSLVRLAAAFTRPPTNDEIADGTADDADDWQPVDPDTVKVRVLDPADDQATFEYSVDVEVVKDDVGLYHYDVDAQQPGTWMYRWESTGVGQAAGEHTFTVAATAFSTPSP